MATRDQDAAARARRQARQQAAIRNSQLNRTIGNIGDRDSQTDRYDVQTGDGGSAFADRVFDGDPSGAYPLRQRSDGSFVVDGPKADLGNPRNDPRNRRFRLQSLNRGPVENDPCQGYLRGQVFNCPVEPDENLGKVQILFLYETATEYEFWLTGHYRPAKSEKIFSLLKADVPFTPRSPTNRLSRWFNVVQNRGRGKFIISVVANSETNVFRKTQASGLEKFESGLPGDSAFVSIIGGGYVRNVLYAGDTSYITTDPLGSAINTAGTDERFWSPRLPAVDANAVNGAGKNEVIILRQGCVSESGAIAMQATGTYLGGGGFTAESFESLWEDPSGSVIVLESVPTIGASQIYTDRVNFSCSNIVNDSVFTIADVSVLSFDNTSVDVLKTSLPSLDTGIISERIYMGSEFEDADVTILAASYHPG